MKPKRSSKRIDNRLEAKGSITAVFRSLPHKELFSTLLGFVIPECLYRESRRDRNWTPD
jgi:hypothetical protein